MVDRPPRPGALAVAVAGLLVVSFLAVGVVWANGAGTDAEPPLTVNDTADTERLLAAAATNEVRIPSETTATLRDTANDTVRYRATTRVDPDATRFRLTVSTTTEGFTGDGRYVTGYADWRLTDGEWRYAERPVFYHRIHLGTLSPDYERLRGEGSRRYDNGTVVVRLRNVSALSYPAVGTPNVATYHIDTSGDVPFPTRVVVRDTERDRAWVYRSERGATVRRPAALPPITLREISERLAQGVRHS